VFENAYSNSNWTGGAIASILTGKRPFSHGLIGGLDNIAADVEPIQSVLSRHGYATAAFLVGVPGEPKYGLTRGFDYIKASKRKAFTFGQYASAAMEWRKTLPQDKDFFMLIHGMDAHVPYLCQPEDGVAKKIGGRFNHDTILYFNNFPGWNIGKLDPDKWERALSLAKDAGFQLALSQACDQCLAQTDRGIAELLKGLESLKDRPVLLIITADHGDMLGEHGFYGHGNFFFDPLVKVPLIIHAPGRSRGAIRIPDRVEHVDLAATICRAASVACPVGMEGRDLLSLNGGPGALGPWAAAGTAWENFSGVVRAAAYGEGNAKISMGRGRWKLFDVAADPGEKKDISLEQPGRFLGLASGYLSLSGAPKPQDLPELAGRSSDFCSPAEPPPADEAPKSPCELTRQRAALAARDRNFPTAAAELDGSNCPAEAIRRDKRTLELIERSLLPAPEQSSGYHFSAWPGRWVVEKGGFSVAYGRNGLECEDGQGRPVTGPGCVAPAGMLLDCIEQYRAEFRRNQPDRRAMEEALRHAGYMQ
jgi:arylsulfatase A-like enzyme